MRTLLLALAVAAYSAGAASVRPRDDGRALVNPDMGLTMHFYSNAPNYGTRIGCEDDMAWFSGCSVGKVDGTPVYALPLAGDDGERRYLLGRVKFR